MIDVVEIVRSGFGEACDRSVFHASIIRPFSRMLLLLAVRVCNQNLTLNEIASMVAKTGEITTDTMRITYIDSELDRVDIESDIELEEALHQANPLLLIISGCRRPPKLHLPVIPSRRILDSILIGAEWVGAVIEDCAEFAYDAVADAYCLTADMVRFGK